MIRPKWLKRKFFEKFPDDLRPGRVSRLLAHFSTAIERLVPLVLFSPTGLADRDRGIRHGVLPLRHPFGDPDGGAAGVERLHDVRGAGVVRRPCRRRPDRYDDAASGVALRPVWPRIVVLGNLFPRKISFLPGMRYYAGNWDTSWWCIKPSANEKIERGLVAIASMPASQLEKFYGSQEQAMIFLYKGYAFRGFNSHGKALLTLVASRVGRAKPGRLRHHRGRATLQHRRRVELR